MAKEIPIPAATGKTLVVRFRVRKEGVVRELVTLGDVLRFIVVRDGYTAPVVSKVTDAGITQDDSGWAQITCTPTDLLRSLFNENYDYVYDLEITEGDTGQQWPLAHGQFEIDIQPQ